MAIAHVVLLAVTIAVAVAAIAYIAGVFSSSVNGRPLLAIMPDSYINVSDVDNYNHYGPSIRLHIVNRGADARVLKIVVNGIGVVERFYLVNRSMSPREAYLATRGIVSDRIPGGSDVWVIAMIPSPAQRPVAGGVYRVDVYTADGSVASALVPAKS